MEESTRQKSKAEYVHSVFESIAQEYDRMNSIISFGMHKIWRKYTMKKMGVKEGEAAIDICCGTCDWTIDLARAVGGRGEVVGLDFSEKMLEIGRMKLERCGLHERVRLVQGDAMRLPFADNRFDYATIGFALRNVADIRQVLSEMKRVVKPGGKVVSLEVSKPPWKPYRRLFYFYFYRILPLLGKLCVNKYEQYSWLPASLTDFPDSEQLAQIFAETGLQNVKTHLFFGGVCALHIGEKKVE
ncbi:demethylmenaquinone methyltransferase [Bacillaceae bacterium]